MYDWPSPEVKERTQGRRSASYSVDLVVRLTFVSAVLASTLLGVGGCNLGNGDPPIQTPSSPSAPTAEPTTNVAPIETPSLPGREPSSEAPSLPGRGASIESSTGRSTTGVDWENYPPALKQRIDDLAEARDCALLQAQFDSAATDASREPGSTPGEMSRLMEYINHKQETAGCKN